MSWHYRLRVRWRMWRSSGADLKRRVEVENVLLAVAAEKRELLTGEECRALAYKLGACGRTNN